MGYAIKTAVFPAPHASDGAGFSIAEGAYVYVKATAGRLYRWDGISTHMMLIADEPAADITDIAAFGGEIYGAGLNGHVYKWNGLSPAISMGGSGAWIDLASVADPLFSIGVHAGNLFVGTSVSGKLYRLDSGPVLTQVANTFGTETEIHFIGSMLGNLFSPTSYSAHLYMWNGVSSWVNKTSATPGFLGQTIVYTLALGSDNRIYAGTRPGGYIVVWNGVDGWSKVAECPAEWTGSKDIHFVCYFNGKIYGVLATQRAMISYDIAAGTTKVELEPLIVPSSHLVLFVYNDKLYFGGDGLYQYVDTSVQVIQELNQGDVRLNYGLDNCDVNIVDNDLERDGGLETAVLISLFSNQRADNTDILP